MELGKRVHSAIEEALENHDMLYNDIESLLSRFDDEVVPYVHSLHKNLTELNLDPSSMEIERHFRIMFHDSEFKGFIDYLDDEKIIDWKTSSGRMKEESAE